MSGGSFDYAYLKVWEFSESLKNILDGKDEEYTDQFSPEIKRALRRIQRQADEMSELMKAVEWLYSGDTGQDTFIKEIEEIRTGRKLCL